MAEAKAPSGQKTWIIVIVIIVVIGAGTGAAFWYKKWKSTQDKKDKITGK